MKIEDWPETITRNGATATREQMHRAFLDWRIERGLHGLIGALSRNGVDLFATDRIADAMIQRAKKKGAIRLGARRKWEWVR